MTDEERLALEAAEGAANIDGTQHQDGTPGQDSTPPAADATPAAPIVNDDPLRGQKLTINGQEVDASEYLRSRLVQVADDERRRQYELEQKRLARKRLGEEIGEFSAVIGDMIKASNGALVTPRDFRQMYNSLDARQQQLFDREMARRDALKLREEDAKRRAEEREKDRNWQLFLLEQKRKDAAQARAAAEAEAQKNREHQERMNRMRIANYYGAQRKPEDDYFINFGNGETKDYKNNTKEGRNVYAAIYQYLHKQGIIPDLEDKDGNVVPVKDQKTADFLVRQYLDYAMQYPEIKSAIYKIVMGKDKDFRDPLTRSIDQYGQQHRQDRQTSERPAWSLVPPPQEGGGVNLPVKPQTDVSTFTF